MLGRRLLVESIACPDCDLLQQIPHLGPGGKAACVRCGRVLVKGRRARATARFALAVAAAIALVVANTFPLMELHVGRAICKHDDCGRRLRNVDAGRTHHQRAGRFLRADRAGRVPVVHDDVCLLAARRSPIPRWSGEMLRWVGHLEVWSMLEVVMLGILVALIKIAQLATVDPGIGMYAFGATMLLIPAITISLDRRDMWRRVEWMDPEIPAAPDRYGKFRRNDEPAGTSRNAGLVSCEVCRLVSRVASAEEAGFCRRCGEKLEVRRHGSIEGAWALLIAAAICYIPANLLPVLDTTTPAGSDGDTIMGGVVFLYHLGIVAAGAGGPDRERDDSAGQAGLAGLPADQRPAGLSQGQSRADAALSNGRRFIGRWSMLDVFVDTFTVALVQLQPSDVGGARTRSAVLRGRRGADHARR